MGDVQFNRVVAALYDPVQAYFERVQAPVHRSYLGRDLSGTVLEIGVGTGSMIPYYERHAATSTVLHGVEPDPLVRRQAEEKLRESDCEMTLLPGDGQSLPYEDGTFDAVVECGVLCSVPDVDRMLGEVARVLAPGGEFRFLDHVRSGGIVGRSQDLLTPLWRRIGGNCHLDRAIGSAIEESDRLVVEDLDRPTIGHWPIREFVRGTAVPVDEGGSSAPADDGEWATTVNGRSDAERAI